MVFKVHTRVLYSTDLSLQKKAEISAYKENQKLTSPFFPSFLRVFVKQKKRQEQQSAQYI